jgi:hypothetical protein
MTAQTALSISKERCAALTRAGTPCQVKVGENARFCYMHAPETASAAAAARKLGGKNRNKPAPAEPIDLSTPDLQRRAIEQTIDRVRRGDESLNTAKVVLYAVSLARPIVEDAMLVERIQALEERKGGTR